MNIPVNPASVPEDLRTQLPTDRELVLRVMPMPADSNSNGDIFGGWIMAQVDLAGSVLPARLARAAWPPWRSTNSSSSSPCPSATC
jgi:acyl-CoA thioesterase YciA